MTVRVVHSEGQLVPRADNTIHFTIEGPGEIVTTDNGDPTNFEPFTSDEREALSGLALVVVLGKQGESAVLTLTVASDGLAGAEVEIETIK